MSTVTLVLSGLSLCNPTTGNGAECLFFHPDSHSLIMKVKTNGTPTQEVELGTQNTIQVSLSNAVDFKPAGAKPFSLVVDFDALHGKSLYLASPPMWTSSHWAVPAASLYTFQQDSNIYHLWKKEGAIRTPQDDNYIVGEKAGMSYDVSIGGSVVVSVTNSLGSTTTYPFFAGNDYEVEFDNTCAGASCGSDYPLYYGMLEQDNVAFEILLPSNPMTPGNICNVASGGRRGSFSDYFQNNKR